MAAVGSAPGTATTAATSATVSKERRILLTTPALPPKPELDGPLAEFSFGKLTAAINWLFEAVHDLVHRLKTLEDSVGSLEDSRATTQPAPQSTTQSLEAAAGTTSEVPPVQLLEKGIQVDPPATEIEEKRYARAVQVGPPITVVEAEGEVEQSVPCATARAQEPPEVREVPPPPAGAPDVPSPSSSSRARVQMMQQLARNVCGPGQELAPLGDQARAGAEAVGAGWDAELAQEMQILEGIFMSFKGDIDRCARSSELNVADGNSSAREESERPQDLQAERRAIDARLKRFESQAVANINVLDRAVSDIKTLQGQVNQNDKALRLQMEKASADIVAVNGTLERHVEQLLEIPKHAARLDVLEENSKTQGVRLDALEETSESQEARLDTLEDKSKSQEALVAKQEERLQQAIKDREAVTLESLGHVDLQEEVRRLRSMMECMEQSLGDEIKQTMEFFRRHEALQKEQLKQEQLKQEELKQELELERSQNPQPSGTGGTMERAGNLSSALRSSPLQRQGPPPQGTAHQAQNASSGLSFLDRGGRDVLEQLEDHSFQQRNLFKVVHHLEREVEKLDAKVDELWASLPKAIALLEPLQAQVDAHRQRAAGAPPAGGRPASARGEVQALAGVVSSVLQDKLKELRIELESVFAQMRDDVGLKASSQEVASLSSRLDAWTQHAPGCAMSQGWRAGGSRAYLGSQVVGLPDGDTTGLGIGVVQSGTQGLGPPGARTKGTVGGISDRRTSCCHDKCKVPTCPRSLGASQSSSRLPELRKQRTEGRV